MEYMDGIKNFGTNPIGIYEKAFPDDLSWEERLTQTREAGFDFLEMSIDDSEARLSRLIWPASKRLALRRSIEATGTPILTLGLSGHRKYPMGSLSDETREKGLEVLHQAIILARDLGIQIIQLMGYDVFYETSNDETKARFLDSLKQGVHWAGAEGIMLGLENIDFETVNCVEKALNFVQNVKSPWLNLYPDIGNLVASSYDPVEQLPLAETYMVGVHVKDTLPGQYRGVPFGKGKVPFSESFKILEEMDFSGPIVIEMWSRFANGDPGKMAAEALQFVSTFLHTESA
jgi:L-ribulose-5-phosphate 3-epimerase